MVAVEIILTIILLLLSIAIIAVICMQESEQGGAGAIYGGDDTIFSSPTKGKDEKLAFYTRIGGIALVVLSIVMAVIQKIG